MNNSIIDKTRHDHMTDKSENMFNESVSALVDAENSELDLRRILKESPENDELKRVWHRYHLAGEIMRGERQASANAQAIDLGFLAGIQEAIADDVPADVVKSSSRFLAWRNGLGKFAVAASVAFGVLIGFQYISPSSDVAGANTLANNEAPLPGPVVPAGFVLPSLSARTVSSLEGRVSSGLVPVAVPLRSSTVAPTWAPTSEEEAALQQRLRRIMLKHAESSAASGGLGVLPFARLEDPSVE